MTYLQSDERSTSGVHYISYFTSPVEIFTETQIHSLYGLFEVDEEISTFAMSALLNFEVDCSRLVNKILENLPQMHHPIKFSILPQFSNYWIINGIAKEINEWLRNQLMMHNFSSPVFLFNILQIAAIFGDYSVLETIETNRMHLISNMNTDQNMGNFDFEYIINKVCQVIRTEPILSNRTSYR